MYGRKTIRALLFVIVCLWSIPSFSKAPAKQIIVLNAIKVEGKIQKPQAFYILHRSNLKFDELKLDQDLVKNIVVDADSDIFKDVDLSVK